MGLPMLLAAGESEQTFWVNLLLVVILAAGWGAFSLFRTRAKRRIGGQSCGTDVSGWYAPVSKSVRFAKDILSRWREGLSRAARLSTVGAASINSPTVTPIEQLPRPAGRRRNLHGGMELLEADFLVRLVEDVGNADPRDVAMRKLGFAELVRRSALIAVKSDALKAYVLDEGGLYGKRIQYEAMKELASRTGDTAQPRTSTSGADSRAGVDGEALSAGR